MPKRFRIFLSLVVASVLFCLLVVSNHLEKDKHFIWKIESPSTTGYLLGSVHVGDASLFPLAAVIEEAFEQSEVLVLEADVFGANQSELQALTLSKALYTNGETLADSLDSEQFGNLRRKLKSHGLDADKFMLFRPWFVAMTITALGLKHIGISEQYGIDKYFYEKAKGVKEIQGLETPRFQIELLANMTEEEQLLMLEYSFEEIENLEESFDKMLNSWKAGDVDGLEKLLLRTREEEPRLERVFSMLFDKRNETMVEGVKSLLKKERPFFAVVGAGHLVGETGMISILQGEGYALEQW